MNRALFYGRFSPRPKGKSVADPESIEVQEARCEDYCRRAGLRMCGRFSDPYVSGRDQLCSRPGGFNLMSATLGSKAPKHVVAMRLDRLFRSVSDGIATLDRWNDCGVTLHLADEGGSSLRTDTAVGWMTAASLLVHSEFSARLTAERTSEAMKSHQAAGRAMGGTAPYGQAFDGDRLVRNDEEAVVQGRIRAHRADGLSWSRIARILNDDSIPCRGKEWNHGSVKRAHGDLSD